MSPEGIKRKLTAILSADVKGYGRFVEDDDEGATVPAPSMHRQVTVGVANNRERVLAHPRPMCHDPRPS